ncbi:DUF6049 family protein, partial [Rhodococcus chondri]
MTVVVSRAGAAVLFVLALVVGMLGVPVPAGAQPQAESDTPRFLELRIDSVTPSVVSLAGEPVVTVRGTVANVGDRDVEDIWVRLQRAPVVSDATGLRTSLTLDQAGFDTVGEFEEVTDLLEQGQEETFTLEMPLRSDAAPSLDIDEPGVYPLLVNVNGVPEYGGQARLDDARFLLPALGIPKSEDATGDEDVTGNGDRDSGSDSGTDSTVGDSTEEGFPAVPPDVSRPTAVTMLWPLADKPRLAAGVPGSTSDPVRLVDDELATSLAEGGRLDGLLRAVEKTTDTEPRVAEALCLAVDPDLLVTVANMTRGYLVVDDPSDPTGDAQPGGGTDAAIAWLARLRTLATSTCTVAVPFAQVDLTALSDAAETSLIEPALRAPARIVDSILGVTSTPGVVWPDSGVLTEEAGRVVAESMTSGGDGASGATGGGDGASGATGGGDGASGATGGGDGASGATGGGDGAS